MGFKSALVWATALFCAFLGTQARADWLAAQAQANGSYSTSGDLATPTQVTAEAVRTLRILGRGAEVAAGDAYLMAEAYHGTEYLSRKIISGVGASALDATLVPELLTHQNSDGGFGEFAGYDSDPLDTAFALDALAASGNTAGSTAALGINYLLQHQNADGSWADTGEVPSVNATALAARSLYAFAAQNAAAAAATANASIFLVSQRSTAGLWTEDHLSAQALLTLATASSDLASIQQSAAALTAAQRADGSWSDDVYSTALALRALTVANARHGTSSSTTGGSLGGTVVSAQTNEPLANVTVVLSGSGLTVHTNSAGYFSISGVTAGNYTVSASLPGFGTSSAVAAVYNSQFSTVGPIILAQASNAAVARGSVFDASTQLPLAGVAISLSGTASYSVTTGAGGSFELDGITAGSYTVVFHDSGYNDVSGSLTATAGSVTAIRQGLTLQGAFLDSSPGTLNGTVIDATTGRAIAGAAMGLSGAGSTTTGADGSFAFASVARGNYQIQATATGYVARAYSLVFAAGVTGNLGSLPLYPATGSAAPTTLTVSGTVVDGVDNHALAGASVTVAGGQTLTTDAHGAFTLSGLTALSFSLTISNTGYQTRGFNGTASGFGQVAGTFALTPASTGTGGTTSILKGTVTDAVSNLPIAGALVNAVGTSLAATSAADGSFEIDNIAPLSLTLTASAAQYTTRSYAMDLTQPGTYSINVQLTPAPGAGTNKFQILSFSAVEGTSGANTVQHFTASIVNLQASAQSAIVLADVLDATGTTIGTISPYVPGTTSLSAQVSFAAGQTVNLVLPWNTAQFAPGGYRLALRVVQPGTVTRDLPLGVVLTQAQANTSVTPTLTIFGQLNFNPPLSQAGSTVPVALGALIVNSGNVPLTGASFTITITDPSGKILVNQPAPPAMIPVGNHSLVSFGTWIPTMAGNLPVTVSASDSSIHGSVTGTLYVGDKATATFTVDKSVVPLGTQTVHGTVTTQGVDAATGISTDPLFAAVKQAMLNGAAFVGPTVRQWNQTNRCMGCHIQTQSLNGMAAAATKANISAADLQYLYNDVAGSLQSNGTILPAYSGFAEEQTDLGIWALAQWKNSAQVLRTLYRGAVWQLGRAATSGNQTWWNNDWCCGIWISNIPSQNMNAVKGMAAALRMAKEVAAAPVNDYTFVDTGQNLGARDILGTQQAADGAVWFVDGPSGTLHRRDPVTQADTVIATGLGAPAIGLFVMPDNTAYVVAPGALTKIAPDGSKTTVLSGGGVQVLWDVTQGLDGSLYVSDYSANVIWRVTPGGVVSQFAVGGLLNNPVGLAFDAAGNLAVANNGGWNILKITPSGTVSVFSDGLPFQPTWLRRSTDGYLYAMTQQYSNNGLQGPGIFRIDANGYVERLPMFYAPEQYGYNALAVINGQVCTNNGSDLHLYCISVGPQDLSQLPAMSAAITGAVNYTLATYNDNTPRNDFEAMRLITLAEARPTISDTTLLANIDAATANLAALLRSRQSADGGWPVNVGGASDSYATAFVGYALDYTNPSAGDPMVRSSISFLLNQQQADGSWPQQTGVFTTKLGPASFVLAYMPLALARLGGIDTTLSLTVPTSVQLSAPSLPPTTQTTAADGSITYAWALQGVTSAGQSVGFNLSLLNMGYQENRPVATAANLQFTNSFSGELITSAISIPSVRAVSALGVAVATDQGSYPANTAVAVNDIVTNAGPASTAAQVHTVILAGNGAIVADLGTTAVGALATGASATLASTWNTGTLLAGSYQVDTKLYDASGTLVDERTAAFNIVTPAIAVTATITTDKSSYPAWGKVLLTSRIRNVSANAIDPAATATVTVKTLAGATLYTTNFSVPSLTPGALQDLLASVHLSDAATGDYPVALTVNDAFSGAVVATASATFHVNRLEVQALTGKVAVQSATVYQGTSELCSETVTNLSSSALAAATLTQSVVSLGTSAVVQTSNQAATFAAKQTQLFSNSVATNTLVPGAYACVLSATIGGVTQQLGAAVFQVQVPPIRMTTALTIGTRGRLLALLDDEADALRGSCGDIELWAPINPLLPPDAAISVVVKDATGAVLDTESTTLAGFKRTVNASASKSDDLSITGVSAGVLTVKLHNAKGLKFGDRITATVTSPSGAIPTLLLQSGPMGAGKGWPFTVGAPLGDFASDEVQPIGAGTLPAVPEPSPATQQAMLVSLVQANHWAYTIVTDEAAFERELRTGTYSNYALLAHRERLNTITHLELAEAVNRGGGLLYATQSDAAPVDDDEAHLGYGSLLGLKIAGTPRNASSVQITNPILSPLGVGSLAFTESTARVTLSGATAMGIFPAFLDAFNTAVATHAYGLGKTVYVGYDLLAEATQAGSASLHAALLQNALEYLRPSFAALTAGEVVPLHVAITNTGIATPGQVQMTLPAGTVLIDAGGAQVTGQTLAWPFSLAQSQQLGFDAWVKLPVAAGATAFDAQIQTGTTGSLVNYTDAKLTLTSTAPPTLATAIALAKSSNSFALESALLTIAQNQVTNGHPNIALLFLLGSATLLNGNTTPTGIALRLDIDQVLWVMSVGL